MNRFSLRADADSALAVDKTLDAVRPSPSVVLGVGSESLLATARRRRRRRPLRHRVG